MAVLTTGGIVALAGALYVSNVNVGFYQYKYVLYIPVVVLIVLLYSSEHVNKLLSFLGMLSLEIYLLHGCIQWFVEPHVGNQYLLLLVSVAISIAAAYLLHRLLVKNQVKQCCEPKIK